MAEQRGAAVIYVTEAFDADAQRCIRAAASGGHRVVVVGEEPARAIPRALRAQITAYQQVRDFCDARAVGAAIRKAGIAPSSIVSVFSDDERAQIPLARVRANDHLPGLSLETAMNFRDKSRMKRLWTACGIPCAGYRLVRTASAAHTAASAIGFPLVIKPIDGMRSQDTYRIATHEQLRRRFDRVRRASPRGVMLEEFIDGDEASCEVMLYKGRLVWYSSTRYIPQPLRVIETAGVHFAVVLPRERHGHDAGRASAIAARAVRALGLHTGMSHVEWFRRADGTIVMSEAAVRVPSAAICLLGELADGTHLIDAWVTLLLSGRSPAPWRRRFAAAAIFLRGSGRGRVTRVRGMQAFLRQFGPAVVATNHPVVGSRVERDWDGNGCILMRSRRTRDLLTAAACARGTVQIIGAR